MHETVPNNWFSSLAAPFCSKWQPDWQTQRPRNKAFPAVLTRHCNQASACSTAALSEQHVRTLHCRTRSGHHQGLEKGWPCRDSKCPLTAPRATGSSLNSSTRLVTAVRVTAETEFQWRTQHHGISWFVLRAYISVCPSQTEQMKKQVKIAREHKQSLGFHWNRWTTGSGLQCVFLFELRLEFEDIS